MTMIPPGKTHRITIVVRGPKDQKTVKRYMAAIRKAVGRTAALTQQPRPRPKAKAKRKRR